MMLNMEIAAMLQQFVIGDIGPGPLGEWIASVDDDDALLESDRFVLDKLRLMLIEYGEGLRPINDALAAAIAALEESGSESFAVNSNTSQEVTPVVGIRAAQVVAQ